MHAGAYVLESELGRGATGVVWAARAPGGRRVAVKVLLAADADALARFERERRLLATLGEAEGFVPIVDAGIEGDRPYVVFPLLGGGTLRQRLARGALPLDEALELGRQLARALGRAHERGIVHRDVKPENVLYTDDGRPLVADLGLAKHFRREGLEGAASRSLSQHALVAGTLGYMPPEQLDDARAAGPPADVFALGVVLHECLAGLPPFRASGIASYADVLRKGPPPLRRERTEVPAWLAAAIARALAVDPARRYPDAGAFARVLEEGGAVRSRVLARAVAGAALAVLLLGLGVLGGLVATGRPHEPAPRPAATPARSPSPSPSPSIDPGALEEERQGNADSKAARYREALAHYTRAVELAPTFARAHRGRACMLNVLMDFPAAHLAATRAVELDPSDAYAWDAKAYSIGWQATEADRRVALEEAERAVKLRPEVDAFYLTRANLERSFGDEAGFRADLDRCLELSPGNPVARLTRAGVRAPKGDFAGAIADLDRAIDTDPSYGVAWRARGGTRLARVVSTPGLDAATRDQELELAIRDSTRALELIGNDPYALMTRAEAHAYRGDKAQALRDAEAIRRTGARDPELLRSIEAIEAQAR